MSSGTAPRAIDPALFTCLCGHPLYDHTGRRAESQSGITYHGCKLCACSKWMNQHGQDFYDGSLRKVWGS